MSKSLCEALYNHVYISCMYRFYIFRIMRDCRVFFGIAMAAPILFLNARTTSTISGGGLMLGKVMTGTLRKMFEAAAFVTLSANAMA